MAAELIVVNGPLAGTRFALSAAEILVGRAPNAKVVLPEADVGWRHCTVRYQGSRYIVTDLRSSAGTYVNGMRSAERWLEDKDQIGIGKTTLMFRSGETAADTAAMPMAADAKPVLLAACSLVFLFRALAATVGEAQNRLLQNQIVRLVGDLVPTKHGILLLGASYK